MNNTDEGISGAVLPFVFNSRGAPAQSPLKPKALEGLKVLAIDDDKDARLLVKTILKRAGAEAVMASSAQEAFELLQSFTPDVIVSDIGMPDENGYELMRRVRRTHAAASHVPAMALTAWGREEDRREALESGFQDHMAKPVDARELEAMVLRLAKLAYH